MNKITEQRVNMIKKLLFSEKRFMCSMCTMTFARRHDMMRHIMRKHKTKNPLSCIVCTKSMAIKPNLLHHRDSHTGQVCYCCSACKAAFPCRDELTAHCLSEHAPENPYSCNVCGKTFRLKVSLSQHKEVHNCNFCAETFVKAEDTVEHKRGHVGTIIYCSKCKDFFRIISAEFIHKCKNTTLKVPPTKGPSMKTLDSPNSEHDAPEIQYDCNVCEKTFSLKISLTKHMETHKCSFCEETFGKEEETVEHKRGHIGESIYCSKCKDTFRISSIDFSHECNNMLTEKVSSVESVFSCFLCKKIFADKQAMTVHIEETYAKDFNCCVCKKSFEHRHHMADHFNMHTSVKCFQCDVCRISFPNGMRLLLHLSGHTSNKTAYFHRLNNVTANVKGRVAENLSTAYTVSKDTVSSPNLLKHSKLQTKPTSIHTEKTHLVCEVCKLTFVQKEEFLEHVKIHTLIPLFTCDVCKATFTKKPEYFGHVKMQTSNLVLFCEECKGTFTQEFHLTTHRNLHTREKLFTCRMCKNTFTHEDDILSHIVKVHNREKPTHCQQCKKPSQKMYPYLCNLGKMKDNEEQFGEGHGSSITLANPGSDITKTTVNGKRSPCSLCGTDCSVSWFTADQTVFCDQCECTSVSCSLCNRNVMFSKLRLHFGQHTGE